MKLTKVKYPITNPLVFAIVMKDAELCRELIERILPGRKISKIRFPEPPSSETEKTIIPGLYAKSVRQMCIRDRLFPFFNPAAHHGSFQAENIIVQNLGGDIQRLMHRQTSAHQCSHGIGILTGSIKQSDLSNHWNFQLYLVPEDPPFLGIKNDL